MSLLQLEETAKIHHLDSLSKQEEVQNHARHSYICTSIQVMYRGHVFKHVKCVFSSNHQSEGRSRARFLEQKYSMDLCLRILSPKNSSKARLPKICEMQ